jgi:hypothetical protein
MIQIPICKRPIFPSRILNLKDPAGIAILWRNLIPKPLKLTTSFAPF